MPEQNEGFKQVIVIGEQEKLEFPHKTPEYIEKIFKENRIREIQQPINIIATHDIGNTDYMNLIKSCGGELIKLEKILEKKEE